MKISINQLGRWVIVVSLYASLCGCFIKPYQFDLYQGNAIPPDRIEQVQPGMRQEQVRYLLGTPLLNDVFATERWDYVYLEKLGRDGSETRRHLVVFFQEGRVARVMRDELCA